MSIRARKPTRSLFSNAPGYSCWRPSIAALLACWFTVCAEPLDLWHWRNPTPTGNQLYGIGANAQRYVAVGELGTILVSDDLNNWLLVESGTQSTLRAVAWGNGLWVAVGDFGEILTSPDGTTWTPRPNGFFFDLTGITWGGGLFVTVGANTSILSSPDGMVWTLRTTGTHPLRTVAWADGTFVAAGGEPPKTVPSGQFSQRIPGQPLVLVSTNGFAWNRAEAPVEGQISSVAFGAGRFVATTTSMRTMVSTDGEHWVAGLETYDDYFLEFHAVAYLVDRFIAAYGTSTTVPSGFLSSADGLRWAFEPWDIVNSGFSGYVRALGVGPRGIAGVTGPLSYSLISHLIASPDGRQWRFCEERLPDFESPVTFAGGRFFLRETSGYINPYQQLTETAYLVSLDGQKWESTAVSAGEWFGLPAYGNGVWVAAGGHGRAVVSTNAITWQEVATGETNQLESAAFAGGMFVLTGAGGSLLTSIDGVNWTPRRLDTTNTLGVVAWSGGIFAVAEVGANVVFTSGDSMSWSRYSMPTNVTAVATLIAWQEGFLALVAVGPYGPSEMLRSTDGRTWLAEYLPDNIVKIATSGGNLLAFRGNGSRTFDARRAGETNWTAHTLPWITTVDRSVYFAPASIAFGRDTFLLTHSGGFILQSEPLTDMAPRLTQPTAAVGSTADSSVTLRATAEGSAPLRYQWRREGTNLPLATLPFLSLLANEVSSNRITVVVENAFGKVESAPATVAMAAPARLEILPDLSALRAWGTPNSRYRIEVTQDLSSAVVWSLFGEVEIPSFGTPARVKNLSAFEYVPIPQRFYRAVIRP